MFDIKEYVFSQISKSQEITRFSEENVAKILEDALKGD